VVLSDFLRVNFPVCWIWKVWFPPFQRTHQISRKNKSKLQDFDGRLH
jgi:hypothetical protein